MSLFRRFLASAMCLSWLSGCTSEPETVSLDALSFPIVLVLRPKSSKAYASRASVVSRKDDLGFMRLSLYSAQTDATESDPPLVIDSNAGIFLMKDIKGEHGTLWMMLNPTGMMPITFKLHRDKASGIDSARAAIIKSEYLGDGIDKDRSDERRRRIQKASSMQEAIQIIDEFP